MNIKKKMFVHLENEFPDIARKLRELIEHSDLGHQPVNETLWYQGPFAFDDVRRENAAIASARGPLTTLEFDDFSDGFHIYTKDPQDDDAIRILFNIEGQDIETVPTLDHVFIMHPNEETMNDATGQSAPTVCAGALHGCVFEIGMTVALTIETLTSVVEFADSAQPPSKK